MTLRLNGGVVLKPPAQLRMRGVEGYCSLSELTRPAVYLHVHQAWVEVCSPNCRRSRKSNQEKPDAATQYNSPSRHFVRDTAPGDSEGVYPRAKGEVHRGSK